MKIQAVRGEGEKMKARKKKKQEGKHPISGCLQLLEIFWNFLGLVEIFV